MPCGRLILLLRALPQMRDQLRGVAWFRHKIGCAESGALGNNIVDKSGENDHRWDSLLRSQPQQYAHSVQPRLHKRKQHAVLIFARTSNPSDATSAVSMSLSAETCSVIIRWNSRSGAAISTRSFIALPLYRIFLLLIHCRYN